MKSRSNRYVIAIYQRQLQVASTTHTHHERNSMNMRRNFIFTAAVAAMFALMSPGAKAGTTSEKIRVTFSQSVEVPGRVLPAGTYMFENLDTSAHLTRIMSADELHVIATVFTVP